MTSGKNRQRLGIWRNVVLAALSHRTHLVPESPLMVYVELTRRCNLRCRHCDLWMSQRQEPGLVSSEVPGDRLLEQLLSLVPFGLAAVDLFGGEPTLRRDLQPLVKGLARGGLHVTVTTNGTLLDESLGAALQEAGLSQLLVSLDGTTPEIHDRIRGVPGTFDRVVSGLQEFQRGGRERIPVGINMLVCRWNLHQIPDMVDLARSLKVRQVRLLPYHQCYPFNQWSQEDDLLIRESDWEALERALRSFEHRARRAGVTTNSSSYLRGIEGWARGQRTPVSCMAGFAVCDINASGEVFPCYTLGQSIGNLQNQTLLDIWHGPLADQFREEHRHCSACWQSCYIEPGLRVSPRAMLTDWQSLVKDLREFLLR